MNMAIPPKMTIRNAKTATTVLTPMSPYPVISRIFVMMHPPSDQVSHNQINAECLQWVETDTHVLPLVGLAQQDCDLCPKLLPRILEGGHDFP